MKAHGLEVQPRRILLATDLSSRGDRAFDRAAQLARAWHSELHVVHAVETVPPSIPLGADVDAYLRKHPDAKAGALRQIRRLVDQIDVPAHAHVEEAAPAQAILMVAEREACDLIMLGETRDRLVGRLESTIDQVVRKSPVSVLAVRNRPRGPYRQLLVGTDFTDEAQQALVASARMFPRSDITLVHAYTIPYAGLLRNTSEGRAWVGEQLTRLRAHLSEAELPPERMEAIRTRVVAGTPAAVLRRHVMDRGADLTVIGAHPRGMLFDTVVGSSRLIVDAIPGDILVVRAVRRSSG